MALLYRFVKINDKANTHVFTFIVTKSVTRDLRDATSKDFTYHYQKWAISFIHEEKLLGVFLRWRNPCVGMRCYADFVFTLLNREHFSMNEVFSAKNCRFTVDQAANGNRKWITIVDLLSRNFTDESGEFQVELALSNVHNFFENDVPHSLFSGHNKMQKFETASFVFANYEWSLTIYPHGDSGERDGKMLIGLNRHTGFDHVCRIQYRVVLGEGDRRLDSGVIDDFSDSEGHSYGWTAKAHLGNLVRRNGVLRVYLEMVSAIAISEIKVDISRTQWNRVFPANAISSTAHCYDRDKHAWCIEADANSEYLRLKIVYKDIHHVARNHLRYVTWSAHVIRRNPKTGLKEVITVQKAPLSHYYVQEEIDDGIIMETDIPIQEINDPAFRFLESSNNLTVQIEWIESLMLFQASYHKYDEVCRAQNYQMRKEISALQAENYHLEQQLVSYQKSLAYFSARGQPTDDLPTLDGYGAAPSSYDDQQGSETD